VRGVHDCIDTDIQQYEQSCANEPRKKLVKAFFPRSGCQFLKLLDHSIEQLCPLLFGVGNLLQDSECLCSLG
jgi:hypothetical protein